MSRFITGVLFTIFLIPTAAWAQFTASFTGNESVTINTNPTYPAPGEVVTATLDDYALGIPFSTITWTVNGVVLENANNSRTITQTAPSVGEKMTIGVKITLPQGVTVGNEVNLIPLYTDIIIEPQTFTPQSYKGRALPTIGSLVRATALIQNKTGMINPAQYSYLWKLNGTTIGGGGQAGGYQIAYTVPNGKNHTLTLEVYDRQGRLITRRGTNVTTSDVTLRLYEISPLYGLANTIIQNPLPVLGNTATLKAVPYNLDLRANAFNTLTEWRLRGNLIQTNSNDPYEITFEKTNQTRSDISFKLRNKDALLQGGEVSAVLAF